jgi:RNA polymerase sigma-70 factor (ECF subfamily)
VTPSVAVHREATDVERVFREVYGQAVATLVRVFGDITLAEDAVQHAFVVASERWRSDGIPPNPAGWIITTARNRAIDDLRRSARGRELHEQLGAAASTVRSSGAGDLGEDGPVRDDQLRLIFTCCHPALRTEHQVALTLRLLGGLSVDEGPLVPGERIGNGKTARPSQIQDQGSQDPLPSARRGRTT